MAVWVFSPSASWSQLPPVWKPCLYWDPSQENSTSNKYRGKTSFNFNKQTNKQTKLSPSFQFDLCSGIDDKSSV